MSNIKIDLTGMKFGRLTVESFAFAKKGNNYWNCVCDCGEIKQVPTGSLTRGHTTSCGCFKKEQANKSNKKRMTTHGERYTRLYSIWADIKKRCLNPNSINYSNYGGRGITICDEWINDYTSFSTWAKDNGYSEDLEIDRIDVNGNYEPSNCRWVTRKVNSNNKRKNRKITINGATKTLSEWVDCYSLDYKVVQSRLNRYKWSIEEALELKPRERDLQKYTYNGVTKSIAEWANEYNMEYKTLRQRLIEMNWLFEEAVGLTARKNPRIKLITYNGETRTIKEWSQVLGIKYSTITNRLQKNKPLDEVFKPVDN